MKLDRFDVPEFRLIPNCVNDIKKIYDTTQFKKITSKDLAQLLGYKTSTSGRFYLRLKSLMSYGLIQSGNTVTELGYQIAYPESPEHEKLSRENAVLHVGLWKELFMQIGNNIPDDFWVPLKNTAKIDAPTAKKYESLVKKWYSEDIAYVDGLGTRQEKSKDQHLTQGSTQNNQMSQQMEVSQTSSLGQLIVPSMGTIQINDGDTLTIARTYLDVLEKKIQEKIKQEIDNVKIIPSEIESIED